MVNELTNTHDGLLSGNYYRAGNWEVSIGRWFWPYLDELRNGISTEPVTTIITLSLISVGNIFMLNIFGIMKSKISYVVCFLFISNTVVTSWLSYRYMSPTFGMSYLISILVAWLLTKGLKIGNIKVNLMNMIFASLLTAIFLGCYQANIACTCLLIVLYWIVLIIDDKSYKELLRQTAASLVSLFAGFILYKIIWNLYLKIYGIGTASYQGADKLSIGKMILSIPNSTIKCYKTYYSYFYSNNILHNLFQDNGVYGIYCTVTVIVLASLLIILMRKTNKVSTLLLVLIVYALIPLVSNASLYLAVDADVSIQMTAGMALVFPCLFAAIVRAYSNLERVGSEVKILRCISIISSLIILYGNIYMVSIDVQAMYDGKQATEELFRNVINELQINNEYSSEKTYVFVGTPADNPSFGKTVFWTRANSYARYGQIRPNWSWMTCASLAVLENLGENLDLSFNYSQEFYNNDEVADMPLFPEEGSIKEFDDCVVIKLSDDYERGN
jgi:hypothetical protein